MWLALEALLRYDYKYRPVGMFFGDAMTRQQQRTEETRSRILEAAAACFARNGYDATGVAEICREARLSKGAFYHHFDTKHEVFLALLNRWLNITDAEMTALAANTASVPNALRSMAGIIGQILVAADQQLPLYLEFWNRAARDPLVWQSTVEPLHRFQAAFSAMIAQGIEQGTLRNVDAQTTARVIIALGAGLLFQGLLDPEGADWQQVSQEAIAMLIEGMTNRK